MIRDDWADLCEALRDLAEGFAATDAANAFLYREEARSFCGLTAPLTDRALAALTAEADALKVRWRDRLCRAEEP